MMLIIKDGPHLITSVTDIRITSAQPSDKNLNPWKPMYGIRVSNGEESYYVAYSREIREMRDVFDFIYHEIVDQKHHENIVIDMGEYGL